MYIKKLSETEDQELIAGTWKIEYAGSICEPRDLKKTFLVIFRVQSVLPLLGKKCAGKRSNKAWQIKL